MNFKIKRQLISNYLDKLYDQLIKDVALISEFQTLVKRCNLETSKLSNYAIAIKEEIKSELVQLSAYKSLDEESKENLLTTIDQIHQQLKIPEFTVTKEECMDVVTVSVDREYRNAAVDKQAQEFLNMGTAIGAFIGFGLGIVIQKNLPFLLISILGGAAIGTVIGKNKNKQKMKRSVEPSIKQTFGKVNKNKFESVIQKRKASIVTLFNQYIQQIEDACQPILK